MNWIETKDRLPDERDKNYRVLAIASKVRTYGNYEGKGILTVVQDWVVRGWPDNFTHWVEIKNLP